MTMVLDMVSICFYSSFVLFSESHMLLKSS